MKGTQQFSRRTATCSRSCRPLFPSIVELHPSSSKSHSWHYVCDRESDSSHRTQRNVSLFLFLSYSYSIDSSLFQETVSLLLKSGLLWGSVKAGSFTPQRFEDQKSDAIVGFLRSNQFVPKKLLKEHHVRNLPDFHLDFLSFRLLLQTRLFGETSRTRFYLDQCHFDRRSVRNDNRVMQRRRVCGVGDGIPRGIHAR